MPSSIHDLINAIPLADQGQVITPLFHNSLRNAVAFLAAQMSEDSAGQIETITMPPLFQRYEGGADWTYASGVASVDATATSAHGALPVVLPNGASIQSLSASGRRVGDAGIFSVKLLRARLSDGDVSTVVSMNLLSAGDPFAATQSAPGSEDLRRVDTSVYTYLIAARAGGVKNLVQLNGVKVIFKRL